MLFLVCGSTCGAIFLLVERTGVGEEDIAEAVRLEAKTWRNKDGAAINNG